jgi:hypothetical protein
LALSKAGRFCPSFANSFTLCLFWSEIALAGNAAFALLPPPLGKVGMGASPNQAASLGSAASTNEQANKRTNEPIRQSVKLLASEGQNQPATAMANCAHLQVPRAGRSDGPSERPAPTRSRIWATFFGDFLFCQKRKLPPAGQALHT